jgi:nitroreductase
MLTKEEMLKHRQAQYTIGPLFLNRWSPRAMSGEEVSMQMMFSLFEAARWAPSSNNNQPWRFLWARRGTDHWDRFLDLLTEPNKLWAVNAAVLIVVVSKTTFDRNGKPSRTHSYDAGAAWENIALQGTAMGLVVHGMQGFSYSRANDELGVPEGYEVEAMIAVGQPGKKEDLPSEMQLQEHPSGRKKVSEIAFEGRFEPPGD